MTVRAGSQVNLKSCCVVPEELSSFAKEQRVTLLTHSDPGELLPGDTLRNMLYPKVAREAGHYFETWIARSPGFSGANVVRLIAIMLIEFLYQVPSPTERQGSAASEEILD
jgi:hypothetical protein